MVDEYQLIGRLYGERRAARSGVRLMNHIDEGLRVLARIGASGEAVRAYCIHPLVQADGDLRDHLHHLSAIDGHIVALAMEYRSVANRCLSTRGIDSEADIELSCLPDVNAMLVADKVQNRKDFEQHHQGSHPQSARLARYFRLWLLRLGVSEAQYRALKEELILMRGE